jgi:ornithine cyclodeaminase/alanine dehydrogenase-like protein (mu-crystallin family)
MTPSILILSRGDVASLLTLDDCITAVEAAFRAHAEGATLGPGILGVRTDGGGFHIKAAGLRGARPYFAAKVNGNFRDNPALRDLPAIQGVIVLADAENGVPLAILDSIEITMLRTGAATAVAARRLARADSRVLLICGCGTQGRIQLRALCRVLPLGQVLAYDLDGERAVRFAAELTGALGLAIEPVSDIGRAALESDAIVTCTPSHRALLGPGDVRPGTFIAAVGADSEDKQELAAGLMARATVVTDVTAQCLAIGELHHAVAAGAMTPGDVHAELAEVVADQRPGRSRDDEIIIFDSTGTALQDVAAAAAVYEKAVAGGRGLSVQLQD